MSLSYTITLNRGVCVRQNEITALHDPHRLIKMVSVSILLTLWAPYVAAVKLLTEGLLMIDPPVVHILSP